MIKFLSYNEIDKSKWDDCIQASSNGNIYAQSWYLDIVHPEWNALVEDDYKSVFPLTGNKKMGINYLFQPFFVQQLGIFSKSKIDKDLVEKFIKAIPQKYRFAEIRLNEQNQFSNAILHKNHTLDLNQPYSEILKNYNSNTKRNLKKAQQSNLKIYKTTRPEEIICLFRENRGQSITHWKDTEYSRLKYLTYTAIKKNKAEIIGVYAEPNELCAGAIFMKDNNRITFLFSGANKQAKQNHALTFLIDYMIRQYSEKQMIFDFEGSDNEGLAQFYKGFGSSEVPYFGLKFNRLPFILRIFKK